MEQADTQNDNDWWRGAALCDMYLRSFRGSDRSLPAPTARLDDRAGRGILASFTRIHKAPDSSAFTPTSDLIAEVAA